MENNIAGDRIYWAIRGLFNRLDQMKNGEMITTLHQTSPAGSIIERGEESPNLTKIFLKDTEIAPDERFYTISFCGKQIPVDVIELSQKSNNNAVCRLVHYTENMEEEYFDIECLSTQYFLLDIAAYTDEVSEYEIKVLNLPPWQIRCGTIDDEDLLDAFPVIVSEDEVVLDNRYVSPVYMTNIYAYLNPFNPNKTFLKNTVTLLNDNLSTHHSTVRLTKDKFSLLNTLALVPGAVLITNSVFNGKTTEEKIYEIQSIDGDFLICSNLLERENHTDESTQINIPVGMIGEEYTKLLYPTEHLFEYSKLDNSVELVHDGYSGKNKNMVEVTGKVYDIIQFAYGSESEKFCSCLDDIYNLINSGFSGDEITQSTIDAVVDMYNKAVHVNELISEITDELSNGNINFILKDSESFFQLDTRVIIKRKQDLTEMVKIVAPELIVT